MKRKLNARARVRRGFSLIELLVVLVILALLVGLVAPRFLGAMGRGQQGAAETQIGNFKTAISTYMLDHNNQPPKSLDELIHPPDGKKTYLDGVTVIPKDPWGRDYEYQLLDDNAPAPYMIRTLGKDGKEGGDGEDKDISSIK
jgi:general secretion pathway protein G